MFKAFDKRRARNRRRKHIRLTLTGTTQRPRLSVFRSLQHIYAQVIDDTEGKTLVSASTNEPDVRGSLSGTKADQARAIGKTLAERAKQQGIDAVVFDRGGYLYHGRVKALADGAREGGLQF